jgi:hypothetical protein
MSHVETRRLLLCVCHVANDEQQETGTRAGCAPICVCQVVRALAKMSSFLSRLPILSKYKTIGYLNLSFFGKLVKYKPQL